MQSLGGVALVGVARKSLGSVGAIGRGVGSVGSGGAGYLPSGHYLNAWQPASIVYPRSDANTTTTARHHWAYYDGTNAPLYKVPLTWLFGSYPPVWSINSGPSGLAVNLYTTAQGGRYYAAAWTPNATYSGTVSITMYNQDGSTPLTFSWTLATTSSAAHFIFVDGVNGHASAPNGGTGTGTISNPFLTMNDWYAGAVGGTGSGTVADTTYKTVCVYYMNATYDMGSMYASGGFVDMGNKPSSHMAYPGQTAVKWNPIATQAVYWNFGHGDVFLQGVEFVGIRSTGPAILLEGNGANTDFCYFENTFDQPATAPGSGVIANFIYFSDNSPAVAQYISIIGNVFKGTNGYDLCENYSTQYGVAEGNDISNNAIISGNGAGFYLKYRLNDSWCFRANGGYTGNSACLVELDDWPADTTTNIEITYNNYIGSGAGMLWGYTSGGTLNNIFMGRNTWSIARHKNDVTMTNLTMINEVCQFTDATANAHGIVNAGSVTGAYTGEELVALNGNFVDSSGDLLAGESAYLGIRGHQIQ